MAQPDPSSSVPQDLMPHVHLVSSYRYPTMAQLDPGEVAKWLMGAPQIARDRAPFFWTYLDRPTDGSIFLTWQPLQRLGNNFASDGLVWAPPEQLYKHDLGNGLMLEIYYHKAGFMPGEPYAMHVRKRFRLIPLPGHPNPPQPDVSLFIVHYGPAEPNDRIPANMVPHDERLTAMMQQRSFLLRAGQIRRKEFMLSDRVNWPSLPELTRQQMGQQVAPRGVPQQMAYPSQAAVGPPSKRARHAQSLDMQPNEMPDDDEDAWRGDMFDHLTPREIAISRYQQNHEWMEEILSSPYGISQITPVDLGLGLKGELASLTEGIFSAQGGEAYKQIPEKSYIGRLDAGQADEFRKRVNGHIESTKKEIEKMQAEHAQALAKFKESSIFSTEEKELRSIVEGSGPEIWRVEGRTDAAEDESRAPQSGKTVDEVVQKVEGATGRSVESKPAVKRVQDGGYQVPAPPPEQAVPTPAPVPTTEMSRQSSHAESQASGILVGESDIDMGNTAAGLLDQMHTGFSSTSTPNNNFPTPQAHLSAAHSNSATPSVSGHASPAVPPTAASQPGADVPMGGTEVPEREQQSGTTPDRGTGSGDWVVVPKSEATPTTGETPTAAEHEDRNPVVPTSERSPAAATPADAEGGGSEASDQNDFSSLGDLDTAGDALAGYDAPALDGSAGELGDGLDLHMDMEDSAFGDAFHGVEDSGTTPGDGNGPDM